MFGLRKSWQNIRDCGCTVLSLTTVCNLGFGGLGVASTKNKLPRDVLWNGELTFTCCQRERSANTLPALIQTGYSSSHSARKNGRPPGQLTTTNHEAPRYPTLRQTIQTLPGISKGNPQVSAKSRMRKNENSLRVQDLRASSEAKFGLFVKSRQEVAQRGPLHLRRWGPNSVSSNFGAKLSKGLEYKIQDLAFRNLGLQGLRFWSSAA